jgi:carbonic anhydrase
MTDELNDNSVAKHETTANATWSRMLDGNRRFLTGKAEHPWQDKETRESLIDSQHPDVAVLSCSDSRVPPEIIFDQGLGDMFTIRTAGEVLDDAVIASLEYAVTSLHVSLITVLGHEHCGAVASSLAAVDTLADELTHEITANGIEFDSDTLIEQKILESQSAIVRSVGMSIQQSREAELDATDDFERVHVARTIEELADRSPVIQQALAHQRLMIIGARYLLTTGVVEVLSV